MENILKEVLIDYVNFIAGYKDLIKSENRIEADFMQMKNGKIGDYSFLYHGAGCRLEKLGVVCEFDFLPENDFSIKFSRWKMYEFFKTSPKWNGLNYNLEDIHTGLLKLVEKGKLFLLELNGVKFPIFQIVVDKIEK